jgi:hypothetical protein
MIESAIHGLLSGIREALVIWVVLVTVAVCVPTLVAVRARVRLAWRRLWRWWRSIPQRRRRAAQARMLRRQAANQELREAVRYAEELAVAAGRAAVAAQRWHAEWAATQRFKEATWQAYDAADRSARRVARASVFPVPDSDLTQADLASRERLLRRVAIDAFRRGHLSPEQLSDLLQHRRGWELDRHPCEHETKLRLVGQAQLLRAYLIASAIERTAWHRAEVAAAAKRALDDEAFAAAMRARYALAPRRRRDDADRGARPDTQPLTVRRAAMTMAVGRV